MRPPDDVPTRLLLVGAGHAHLHLIRSADRLRAAGYAVTLVAPRWFRYSGTASAVATGDLLPDAGAIDVAALARACGVRHVVGRLTDVDLDRRAGSTDAGAHVAWDLLCLNLGSVVAASAPGVTRGAALAPGVVVGTGAVLTAKPLEGLAGLRSAVASGGRARTAGVTVVGGGNSGVELAAHCAAALQVAVGGAATDGTGGAPGAPAQVRLIEAGPRLAPELPARASHRLRRHLEERGVQVRTGATVATVGADHVLLADGTRIPHGIAVLASGLTAPPEVQAWGLGDEHGVPVLPTLRHRDHPTVYATGDCAHFLAQPLPHVGVHGVRQGPVLLAALLARVAGDPEPVYVPPRRYLVVLDLGGGRALAHRGRWWWLGSSARRLKALIDQRWLARYRL